MIGYGATISAPHMHAICLELLSDNLQPGNRVSMRSDPPLLLMLRELDAMVLLPFSTAARLACKRHAKAHQMHRNAWNTMERSAAIMTTTI